MAKSIAVFIVAAALAATVALAGPVRPDGSSAPASPPPAVRQHAHQHEDDWELSANAQRQALDAELQNEHWLKQARDFVEKQRLEKPNVGRAKNVIMFLGDGMSAATIAATRPYVSAEQTELYFEKFPSVGMAKTYCVNYQVSDSSATGTAYLGGVKANYGTIGVTAAVPRYNCTEQLKPENRVRSIAGWAQDAGKWTGFITTAEVTDASPAGLYAHVANRNWENDVEVRKHCDDPRVEDIAMQLVNGEVGEKMRVIMGGGRTEFRGVEVDDEESGKGLRGDKRNLIEEWQAKKSGQQSVYVWNATHLRSIDGSKTDYVLALFEPSAMRFAREVEASRAEHLEPTLTEMVLKAIEVLSRNADGFFLFVENQKIDSAHHSSFARLALDETAELAKAVEAARAVLPEEDTLIVVTADHSHTMSYAGYPYRGNDITGKVFNSSDDAMPLMTLSYANGVGFQNQWQDGKRKNLTDVDTSALRWRYPATVPGTTETHAGEDVAVYASGPWSHLFNGIYEQNAIPHLIAHAACLSGACEEKGEQ